MGFSARMLILGLLTGCSASPSLVGGNGAATGSAVTARQVQALVHAKGDPGAIVIQAGAIVDATESVSAEIAEN